MRSPAEGLADNEASIDGGTRAATAASTTTPAGWIDHAGLQFQISIHRARIDRRRKRPDLPPIRRPDAEYTSARTTH